MNRAGCIIEAPTKDQWLARYSEQNTQAKFDHAPMVACHSHSLNLQ